MTELATSIERYRLTARHRDWAWIAFLVALCGVEALLVLAFPPGTSAVVVSIGVAMVVGTWYRPVVGVAGLLGITLLLEQMRFADQFSPVTYNVPFFDNLTTYTGVGGLVVTPLEIIVCGIIGIWLVRTAIHREHFKPEPLIWPVLVWGVMLVAWLVVGLGAGGEQNIAIQEVRAQFYFVILALLVPQVVESVDDVKLLVWVIIGVIIIKAAQGLWSYAVVLQGDLGEISALTSHEDALFFAFLVVLLAALLTYRADQWQTFVLLAGMPLVLFTFVATNRRGAYVALALGLIVYAVLIATDPEHRHVLFTVGLPLLLVTLMVIGYGWNNQGAIGRPARAIKSISEPESTEDKQSNRYREVEAYNLIMTIKETPFAGVGFGKPYAELAEMDEVGFNLQSYIPHNEIFWVWVKTGTIGFAIFWAMMCSFIAYGTILFRALKHPYVRVIAAATVVLVVMQLVISFVDLQLTFARNMVLLGVLIGVLSRLVALDAREGDGHELA